MSWLNLNESLTSLKGQISSFANGVLAEGIVNDADPFTELSGAQQKIQELQNLCASQDVEITSLRRQNAELYEKLSFGSGNKPATNDHQPNDDDGGGGSNGENWFWDPPASENHHHNHNASAIRKNSTNSTISDLSNRIKHLELEKQDLVQSLEQLDQDCQRTTDKLVTLKDHLQTDYNQLKNDYDLLKTENESILNDNQKYMVELKKLADEINKLKSSSNSSSSSTNNVQNNVIDKKLFDDLQLKYNIISKEKETHDLNLETYKSNLKKIQEDYDKLKQHLSELETNKSEDHDKQEMHKKYVNILTETVKKYVDYSIPEEFVQKPNETSEISEFNSKVETVLKLLLDFKWKTETLERKMCEISHEKTVAITEKNHEIEKLLHNSEILSQEVITKTQTIKHYEMECSELIKNNDLLIAELQQYKNNNGLQTISESNEDNLLLMETQLENANKRIRELEMAINEMENAKQDVALETQTELDYIKRQLNMTGNELSQSKMEYQELLKLSKQYESDNKNLNAELVNLKTTCDSHLNEKQTLESLIDKMKSDIENTEYKFTEANVDLDSIKEDYQKIKLDCANLTNINEHLTSIKKELENKIEHSQKEIDSLKTQLETVVSIREQLEQQTRSLTEKLQSSKMTETGLKLQNDTIKQEFFQISNAFKHLKLNNTMLKDSSLDNENLTIIQKIEILNEHFKNLHQDTELQQQITDFQKQIADLQNENIELSSMNKQLETETLNMKAQLEDLSKTPQVNYSAEELESSRSQISELSSKISELEAEINTLNASKAELVNFLQTKHQENIQYHSEIQRLIQIISQETEKSKTLEQQLAATTIDNSLQEDVEKLNDQNNFLKEKCEKLTHNLLEEQSNTQKILAERQLIFEREQSLTKELERLRLHLVEIEDSYTKELLQAEQKNQEMLTKVNEIEQRERDSSTIYTSVSIRANQQVETLQNQLQLVTVQRDDLQKKISEAEDRNNKQFAALTNLQCVLEQFQRDREIDIHNETERIRRQINVEKQKQNELQDEINMLKGQLEESKQGLKAAARLTEQMEKSKLQVVSMKDEVTKLQNQLTKSEENYKVLSSKTNATVDKSLIKNLIIGFISSNKNLNIDQKQILKIISTVLDFSQQDNDKLNIAKTGQGGGGTGNSNSGGSGSGSWLNSILHPQISNSTISQQSLSEAFVRFLENESQPKPTPPPLMNVRKMSTESNASTGSSSTRQTPILLNEVVLPTFADFAQNRNSSSILKDVLKEN